MDVLLVAARRDSVAALAAVIADAGHTPAVVDVGALALQNAHQATARGGRGSTVALLDIGASATTVTIVVNGEPAFVRHVSLGGQAYTEALQARLRLVVRGRRSTEETAPRSRRARRHSTAAQRPITDALLGEIRKTLDFFRSTTGTERIDSLVVSGGGSLLEG